MLFGRIYETKQYGLWPPSPNFRQLAVTVDGFGRAGRKEGLSPFVLVRL